MLDRLTGQYYLRARYYVPETGRFTQADTFHGDGLNLYVYAGNNPVRYVDPDGHCCKSGDVYECGRSYIGYSGEMFRKARNATRIEPMPKKQLQKIVKAFKRQGGIIQMNDATDIYLNSKKAEAITLNENTILLHQKPGRASVFEELIHATQFRLGLNDGSVISRIQNEIAAQEMLLKNSKAYKLTPAEITQTQSALESYIEELQVLMGGK